MEVLSMKGLVEKAHGKVCQDDNNSVSYRKKDGKMFSMRRCNNRNLETKPYSEKELSIQSGFTSKSKVASAWTKANRVYKTGTRVIDLSASTEAYRKMRAAFDAQGKVTTFQAFVWKQIKNGAVVVPDVEVSAGTGGSTNSGGGTQGGGTQGGGSQSGGSSNDDYES